MKWKKGDYYLLDYNNKNNGGPIGIFRITDIGSGRYASEVIYDEEYRGALHKIGQKFNEDLYELNRRRSRRKLTEEEAIAWCI